jgi:hydroxypyruvate isomerase
VRAVNAPGIKVLFDCYHMQIMEGNLVNNIKTNIDFIGHFHSAGVPGRHELHKGETDYPFVISAAEDAGYERYFGLEYMPSYEDIQSVKDVLDYVRSYKTKTKKFT